MRSRTSRSMSTCRRFVSGRARAGRQESCQCIRSWELRFKRRWRMATSTKGASSTYTGDGASLGAKGGRESGTARCDTAGPGSEHSHVPPQLRTAPADERHPDQLSESLAGPQLDPDDAHLPGACAGPVREPGGCALRPLSLRAARLQQPHNHHPEPAQRRS